MTLVRYGSILAALEAQVQARPQQRALVFLSAGKISHEVTYGRLQADLWAAAKRLHSQGVGPGQIVGLAAEQSYLLLPNFLGAIYLGALPVVLPFFDSQFPVERYVSQVQSYVKRICIDFILTLPELCEALETGLAAHSCSVMILPTPVGCDEIALPTRYPGKGEAAAYLQLSSGTTSDPKAVIFPHRALLTAVQNLARHWSVSAADVSVGWLPIHHDGGMMMHVFLPLLVGATAVLMPPSQWVRRPGMLLQIINKFRGTFTFMPNFAVNHCVRNIRDREMDGVDLNSLRLLVSGAELVYPETMNAFSERFSAYGYSAKAFTVAYGMTEAGVLSSTFPGDAIVTDWVSGRTLVQNGIAEPTNPAAEDAKSVVCCGQPLAGVEIRVVDDDGKPLPERQTGEIQIRGQSLCPAYFDGVNGNHNSIPDLIGWFSTGDIGYMADEQVYICDRKKDLIISAGHNIIPQAIEAIAVDVLGERAGNIAAVGIPNRTLGTELPVLICEVRGRARENELEIWPGKLRHRVNNELGITLADIRFVRRGWLVKTTSGKVARNAARDKYLAEGHRPDPPALALLRSAGDDPILLEQALTVLAAQILGVPSVQPEDNFFELGADSFALVRFVMAVEEGYDRQVPTDFFQKPTVAHLAQILQKEPVSPQATQPVAANSVRPIKALKRLFVQAWRGAAFSKRFAKRLILRAGRYAFYLSGRCGYGVQYYRYSVRLWRFYYGANSLQRYNKRRQVYLVVQFLEKTGLDEHKPQQIVREILVNRRLRQLTGWGKFPYLPDAQWQQLVFIENQSLLDEALAGRTGVVIVTYHSIWTNLLPRLILMCDVPVALIRRSGRIDLARQLLEAYRVLADGGIVTIAADSAPPGSSSSEVHFFNRICYFPNGFAKLAIATDAVVLSSHIMVTLEGKFHIRLRSLQNPKDVSDLPSERFDRLVENYVQHLQQIWATGPELISTEQIRQYLDVDSTAFVWGEM